MVSRNREWNQPEKGKMTVEQAGEKGGHKGGEKIQAEVQEYEQLKKEGKIKNKENKW